MPHVADLFTGHVFNDDPRNLLTAAFACNWPTFPAQRYQFVCPNAVGFYFLFNFYAPLVERTTSPNEHLFGEWELVGAQPPFDALLLRKLPIDNELDGFEWTVAWKYSFDPGTYTNSETYPTGKCNVDYDLPDWSQGGDPWGSMGADAKLRQVVWDETEAPT
jgi:hypothetical protein